MTRTLARLLALAITALIAFPAAALALAGGATGGGGGGGSGGGFSGGGGGSGSSCTGDGCGLALGFVILLVIAFVGGSMLLAWIANARRRRRISKVEAAAGAANYDDGYWELQGVALVESVGHKWPRERDVASLPGALDREEAFVHAHLERPCSRSRTGATGSRA